MQMPDANLRHIHAAVVVVGSGPTGAAATWRLAQAGIDVLCLERGAWMDYDTLERGASDWDLRRSGPLHPNPNIRLAHRTGWQGDGPIDDSQSPIKPMIGAAVGGSSLHWSAHVPRFRPEDFRVRTLDGVAEDWPISYDDLEPWYDLNENRIGAAFLVGDPSSPPRRAAPLPLPSLGPHGRRMATAFDRLGWHWWPVDLAAGTDARADVACDHSGPCDLGCPARLRSGADRAYMRPALAAGARLETGLRAYRLIQDASRRILAVNCHSDAGDVTVTGEYFILCGNGIGTPWLLLNSAQTDAPHGVANSSGQVGKNLMLHPYARVDGLFEEPLGTWSRGEKAGLISLEFYAAKGQRDFARGFKLQLSPAGSPLALASGGVTGASLPWGEGHHAAFERQFDRLAGLTVCIEDLPDPANMIALSDAMADEDGEPAPQMIYRLSAESARCLSFGIARATEALKCAGAVAIFTDPLKAQAGFHLMGTARMGHDPATSVVNAWGRCHDVENLYVGDSSVFVTSGCLNPTATAQAFALRVADHLIGKMARA